jgi:hypothetical protein
MHNDHKAKIQNSLVFHESDIWDSVMLILREAEAAELLTAVSQTTEEAKRAHQCGRADGVQFAIQLLNDTRELALHNVKRKPLDK